MVEQPVLTQRRHDAGEATDEDRDAHRGEAEARADREPDRDQLGDAEVLVDERGAEVAGVNRSPSAAPYLALARDNLTRAEREIRDGDNEEAALTLERAEADADLAQAISSEEKERLLSLQAKKRTQELRTQMQP